MSETTIPLEIQESNSDIQRKRAVMEEMTPFDLSCAPKGNPFVGDTPEETMKNVCGVLQVLEETALHERESGDALYEHTGRYLLFSGLANALQIHVQHMEHEAEGDEATDTDSTQ